MSHVKLFEQFINEVYELDRFYPFRFTGTKNSNHGAEYHYEFKNKNDKTYKVYLVSNMDGSYSLNFTEGDLNFDSMTNERDQYTVISTVFNILFDILTDPKIDKKPIVISGMHSPGEDQDSISKRYRVYRQIALKNRIKFEALGYNVIDQGDSIIIDQKEKL